MLQSVCRTVVSVMVLDSAGCGFGEADDRAGTTLPPVTTTSS
jgi:hypothetical protein